MNAFKSRLLPSRQTLSLCAAGVIALAVILSGAPGAAAQESGYGPCIQAASGYSGCNASDLGFGAWYVLDINGRCTGPSSTVQVLLEGTATSTSNRNDDLAFWINVNGGNAITDPTANACYRHVLNPVVASPFAGLNLAGGEGPYRSYDGDYCGDIGQNELTYANFQQLTLPCVDNDNNGALDFSACLSYAQNAQAVCNNYLQALPGTTSKCLCSTTNVAVTVINMTITKSCTPSVIPVDATDRSVQCTVTYKNNSAISASSFSLVDNYDQTKGVVSNIGSTNPGGNPGTDNGDTITWLLPAVPAGGTGSVTYTYTINAGLPQDTIIANTATLYYQSVEQDIASAQSLLIGTPLAVDLVSFAAEATAEGVTVGWETVSEQTTQGFNLYRSTAEGETGVKLNENLISAQAAGTSNGAPYSYVDRQELVAGTTYYYRLESMDFDGAAMLHDPVAVVYSGPTAVTLSGFAVGGLEAPALAALAALALAVLGSAVLRRSRSR